MSAIILRDCEASDLPAIASIYAHAVLTGTASFEMEPPTEAEMAARRRALLDGQYPYLVALVDGVLAGYAYAGPYRARPAYRGTVENSVYVGDRFRRRGVARTLLEALIDGAAARGFRQMVAVIGDTANAPSIRLHEACGFTHVGTLRSVGWKHGLWLDTVLMQLALGPGDTLPSEPTRPA